MNIFNDSRAWFSLPKSGVVLWIDRRLRLAAGYELTSSDWTILVMRGSSNTRGLYIWLGRVLISVAASFYRERA